MTIYATGNPVGSTNPKDLLDNAQNIDYWAIGPLLSYPDRRGVNRLSWAGIEASFAAAQAARATEFAATQAAKQAQFDAAENTRASVFDASQDEREDAFNQFLGGSGWSSLGAYAAGISIVSHSQTVDYLGQPYSLKPSVPASVTSPYVTSGNWGAEGANFKLVGDNSLRQDLSNGSGALVDAEIVGWRGGNAGNFLDGGWFTPSDLDMTGVVDNSAKVLAYLAAHKRVRLPAGSVKLDITVPSDRSLFGAGELTWDAGSGQWLGAGTLILGNVRFNNRQRVTFGLASVDAFTGGGNAISGQGPNTSNVYLARVNTRANNHGHLWEQNGSDPLGSIGGNIVLEDCNHFGGPNGFAVKMRNVALLRCNASGTTVQAFPIVSDNINGAGVYSRATNVRLIDCGGSGNKTTLRVYTRDEFSTNNANGVQPASNIRWIRGELSGCSEHGSHIGDFFQGTPTRTQINCEDVQILGARAVSNTLRAVIITLGDRITAKLCTLGGNGGGNNITFDSFGTRVTSLDVTENYTYGSAVGAECGVILVPVGSAILNASHGGKVYKTANTAVTTIATFSGGRPGQELTLQIDDNFSICTVGGVSVTGKGTCAEYAYDSSLATWICKSATHAQEGTTGWASTTTLDYSNPGITSRFVALNGTTASMALVAPFISLVGRTYTLRLTPGNAGGKAITAWSSAFKFSTAVPAPTVVPDGTTTVIAFYWSGSFMVATSAVNYAN